MRSFRSFNVCSLFLDQSINVLSFTLSRTFFSAVFIAEWVNRGSLLVWEILESLLDPFQFIYCYYYFGMGKSYKMKIMSWKPKKKRKKNTRNNNWNERQTLAPNLNCMHNVPTKSRYQASLWAYDVRRVSFICALVNHNDLV